MSQNSIKIAGVIAEFNPFHDGHAYLLKKAREVAGADFVVVVMSGNFVQRGTPAVMEKSLRVRAALTHGADAVFELPVRAATGSADYFAEGAVHLLTFLGVTDLCFGCETDDLSALEQLADVLAEEPEPFRKSLKCGLKDGLSYAAAVQRAVKAYQMVSPHQTEEVSQVMPTHQTAEASQVMPAHQTAEVSQVMPAHQTVKASHASNASQEPASDLTSLLSLPNNLLAVSYLKALRKCSSSIRPHAILRVGDSYHSEAPTPVAEAFPSAASLRKLMKACLSRTSLSGVNLSAVDLSDENFSGKTVSLRNAGSVNPATTDQASITAAAAAGQTSITAAATTDQTSITAAATTDQTSITAAATTDQTSITAATTTDQTFTTAAAAADCAAFVSLKPYLSENLFSLYQPGFGQSFPIFPDDFSLLLGKTLLDLKPEDAYFDCVPDLYRRIYNNRRDFTSFDDFCQRVHTKQFSLASTRRGVLHCMLGLKVGGSDSLCAEIRATPSPKKQSPPPDENKNVLPDESKNTLHAAYLPLLGFRRGARPLLTEISRRSPLPLLSKTCEGRNLPDPQAVRQWEEIMHADALYRLVRCWRFGREFPLPEQAQILVETVM